MTQMRFDGRVAIVTGAGSGLGRSHALALAARGARVVVNDLGVSLSGEAARSNAAEETVELIRAAGGEALADPSSVTDPEAMDAAVHRALKTWGRVDILIANAGILRDKTFAKMEVADFEAVARTHLMGAVVPLKAAWPTFKAQGYGRVCLTTSGAGLWGSFGQSNYGAAKMGLVGLMNSLKLEGEKDGVRVNAIAPIAATRMTEGLLRPSFVAAVTPEAVSAGVLHLVSEEAPNGIILSAGAGIFSTVRLVETAGADLGLEPTPESVRDQWFAITDPGGERSHPDMVSQVRAVADRRTPNQS